MSDYAKRNDALGRLHVHLYQAGKRLIAMYVVSGPVATERTTPKQGYQLLSSISLFVVSCKSCEKYPRTSPLPSAQCLLMPQSAQQAKHFKLPSNIILVCLRNSNQQLFS